MTRAAGKPPHEERAGPKVPTAGVGFEKLGTTYAYFWKDNQI